MRLDRTVLAVTMAVALLAGCKKEQAEVAAPADAAESAEVAAPAADVAEQVAVEAPATAVPAVAAFDIGTLAVSDKPLGAWPYITMPAGYALGHADELASRSKDLARVPVWTGGQLLWVEGKTFSDAIRSDDGKTYSKFEVRKNLQQAIEALGGVRIGERSYDEATYKANEKALDDFRQEFDRIRDAYWYDADADTYVIRRADKAVWVVLQTGNGDGGILVAEGPLPDAPAE